ncbi:MAG: RNA chaperone Hfq [Gammaproteobacteria bacterium]|nr:RNA chaperone Hfq [Gammaproteobacteria bacterium]
MGSVEEKYIKGLIDNKVEVFIFLKSGIKLTGKIMAANQSVIFLGCPIVQMIYKKYISTIVDPSLIT